MPLLRLVLLVSHEGHNSAILLSPHHVASRGSISEEDVWHQWDREISRNYRPIVPEK